MRNACAWAMVLALVLVNGLRLTQVESFIHQHRGQVPPLAEPVYRAHPEVVFVNMAAGLYTQDMVQNDPFLRSPRVVMIYDSRSNVATLMARRFPAYVRSAEGEWGELWTAAASASPNR
jgi:hypothetical protein